MDTEKHDEEDKETIALATGGFFKMVAVHYGDRGKSRDDSRSEHKQCLGVSVGINVLLIPSNASGSAAPSGSDRHFMGNLILGFQDV
jgi:hypothetical protein